MDRGAWRATVLGVAKSRTQAKQLSMHAWPLLKPQHRPPGTVLGGSLLFWLLIPLENSRELQSQIILNSNHASVRWDEGGGKSRDQEIGLSPNVCLVLLLQTEQGSCEDVVRIMWSSRQEPVHWFLHNNNCCSTSFKYVFHNSAGSPSVSLPCPFQFHWEDIGQIPAGLHSCSQHWVSNSHFFFSSSKRLCGQPFTGVQRKVHQIGCQETWVPSAVGTCISKPL